MANQPVNRANKSHCTSTGALFVAYPTLGAEPTGNIAKASNRSKARRSNKKSQDS